MKIPSWVDDSYHVDPNNLSVVRSHNSDKTDLWSEKVYVLDHSIQEILFRGSIVEAYDALCGFCTRRDLEHLFGMDLPDIERRSLLSPPEDEEDYLDYFGGLPEEDSKAKSGKGEKYSVCGTCRAILDDEECWNCSDMDPILRNPSLQD